MKRPEIGELFRVGDRSVSQERRRMRDRLSDDRNAQNLSKGLLGKCNDWRIAPLAKTPPWEKDLTEAISILPV